MPWQPLPRIAFAVATYPFQASSPADLPLELGDELYIIEQGGKDGAWFRGYLVAPPSLLAGLTSVKGQTLEARVFSGIFPRSCVEVREVLGDGSEQGFSDDERHEDVNGHGVVAATPTGSEFSGKSRQSKSSRDKGRDSKTDKRKKDRDRTKTTANGLTNLAVPTPRDPNAPKPPAPVPMLKIGDETPTSAEEPLVDEIASCLREWHSTYLHEMLLSRQYPLLDRMASLVHTLDFSRRQFLYNVLTTYELDRLREKTVWDLVKGNKLLNKEVIVRDPAARGRVLTGDDSAVEITKLQSMMSLLDERPQQAVESLALHHLLVDAKAFVGASKEPTTLVFYLAIKTPGAPAVTLSESYIVDVPPGGTMANIAKAHSMRTLFTDLGAADIGDQPGAETELYLVVKVRTSSAPVVTKSSTSHSTSTPRENSSSANKGIEKPPLTSGTIKAVGRRSLMWGQKAQRAAFSRGIPGSKLGSVTENVEAPPQSRDATLQSRGTEPPGTAGSRGPAASGDNLASMQAPQLVTRTVGIGALKLNAIMKQEEEVEHVLNIWTPSTRFSEGNEAGEGWVEVIKDLMDSQAGTYEKSRSAERLHVHLKPFVNPDADVLIKATPTLLSGITQTHRMGFAGAPTKPRSDIYITMSQAFLPRHALLSRSTGGSTALSSQVSCSNLQVLLEVRKSSGERIENCIFASSNHEAASSWESPVADRHEKWEATVRLAIPVDEVQSSHLVMLVSDVPHQPFSMSFMPLWDQQAFMRDGPHSLLMYKYDEALQGMLPNAAGKGGYLHLPWSARGKDDSGKEDVALGPVATLRLKSYLCSTRFSQDNVLLSLISWKSHTAKIPELLKQLVFVPEIEIVKLLTDVFDSLFAILVEYSGNDDYEDMVFSALVTVLGIIQDRRFNIGPLVDQYAEEKFNYPFATPCLVRSFIRLLANPADAETSRKLRATFKVTRHILKFITHARDQQKAKEVGIGINGASPGFARHLKSIFKSLDTLMRNSAPILVGSQTLAVQHFHTWLPELVGLLSTEEIVHIAIDFVDSCTKVKGKLILYKLVLIINYSRLSLFSHPDQRTALSVNTVRWLAPHWGKVDQVTEQWRDQVRLCCSILATQIDDLGQQIPDYVPKIIDSYLTIQAADRQEKSRLSLLFPTQYPFPSKPIKNSIVFDESLMELSAVLAAISNHSSGMQLEMTDQDMASLLDNILRVHSSILQGDAFPENWLSVQIYQHKSTMKNLQYIADIMLESFLPEPDDAEIYQTELWKVFFTTLLKLVGSDALALETFPEQKRRAVWKIAGDVREHGAELLRRTWTAIGWETSSQDRKQYGLTKMGGYQVQYVPVLVGPIVQLCLSVHEGLRRVAVEVLQTMIVSEWALSEDLSVIQTEMIDCLDELFKSKPLTESIHQKLFINELMILFDPVAESSPDDPLYEALKNLVGTIDEFLDLLVAVHSPDMSGEVSHMINRLQLMDFLRDMQKEEIFIRYVHQLAQLQAEARSSTEAGLALRLHADLYDWDPTKMLPALIEPDFPAQSQFDRKERIYFDMISHFENGEAWSIALAAYKELQTQYEENVFDFPKLARTQRAIAAIHEKIAKAERIVSKYYRVVYRGMGFPPGLRDKEFVLEGSPNERATAFTDRMQEQHPSAQIVTSGDVDDVEGQFLQISALSVHRDLDHPVFQRSKIPHVVRDFLLSSHPQVFSYTARRSTNGPVTEHWAEKIVYTTIEPFPTILRRSEIVSTEKVRLTPLQTGLERIVRKTQEMTSVEKRVNDGEDEMIPLLIESLNISVDPSSEASVARYRDLLPVSTDPDQEEVEYQPLENSIKIALLDHAIMIKRCLGMFSKSSNPKLRAGYDELNQNFETTFASEIAALNSTLPRASPTSPLYNISSPKGSTISPLPGLVNANTNGTFSPPEASNVTSPEDKQRQRNNRLSFLKRSQPEFFAGPKINGTADDNKPAGAPTGRSRKENRLSFFQNAIGVHAHQTVTNGSSTDKTDSGNEWATPSGVPRRSSSSQRGEEHDIVTANSVLNTRMGSMKKRLSVLNLGKKSSRTNVRVTSVLEE